MPDHTRRVWSLLPLRVSAGGSRLPPPGQGPELTSAVRAQVYVAELDPVLNVRTLTDYDVKRFFTQFGATPLGVWSNPIGNWVEDKDDMELRNTYMYGLDVMFHRCEIRCPWAHLPASHARGASAPHSVKDPSQRDAERRYHSF